MNPNLLGPKHANPRLEPKDLQKYIFLLHFSTKLKLSIVAIQFLLQQNTSSVRSVSIFSNPEKLLIIVPSDSVSKTRPSRCCSVVVTIVSLHFLAHEQSFSSEILRKYQKGIKGNTLKLRNPFQPVHLFCVSLVSVKEKSK